MRLFLAISFFVSFVLIGGCGSRTPLDDTWTPLGDGGDPSRDPANVGHDKDPAGSDAGDAGRDASPRDWPADVHPPGYVCFGEITRVHGVTCEASVSRAGKTCDGALRCNGDHEITIHCEDGLCTCDNLRFNTCFCRVTPGVDEPCGPENCCWQ